MPKMAEGETRITTVNVSVSLHERDVIRALAFIEAKSHSNIIYPWIKPYLDAARKRPDVQMIIAQKEDIVREAAS